jgi:hypothetical protein
MSASLISRLTDKLIFSAGAMMRGAERSTPYIINISVLRKLF